MKRACGPAFVEFGQIDIHSSVDLGWKPPTTQPLCLLKIWEVGVFLMLGIRDRNNLMTWRSRLILHEYSVLTSSQ